MSLAGRLNKGERMRNNQFSKYRSLGLNIAYYRKDRGLSQSELAERVNISRTHMSRKRKRLRRFLTARAEQSPAPTRPY